VLLQLENRSSSAESFVVGQREASRDARQSTGTVYFDYELYLQGPIISRERFEEDVDKFAAEHFFKATSRLAYFDGVDWSHPNGEKYKDFFDRAREYHTKSPKLVERFDAEYKGFYNAGEIINYNKRIGKDAPTMMIASPPGEVYMSLGFKPRIMIFVLRPVCERAISLGGQTAKVYQEYQMIAIPGENTSTRDTWVMVSENADLKTAYKVMKISEQLLNADDPNVVVSTALPIVTEASISALNTLANQLKYIDFDEVSRETENTLVLEKDPKATQRRKEMIQYFTEKMWDYVIRRNELSEQEKLRFKNWTDVMHDYLSAEGGYEYLNMNFEDIKPKIKAHMMMNLRDADITLSHSELKYTDWNYAEYAYRDYFYRLQQNTRTQESRANGGCPVNMNMTEGFGYESTVTEGFGYESTVTDLLGNTNTAETNSNPDMKCVECPNCHASVDAIMTSSQIECPKCHHTVSR